ncbi:MAG: hypothetical protein KC464_26985 [Myxococcales bacterium]|nr:hypothetical protein [Myxococcales bacterium]
MVCRVVGADEQNVDEAVVARRAPLFTVAASISAPLRPAGSRNLKGLTMARGRPRAFLFAWNPAKFKESKWKTLDQLVADGGGDDDWSTSSGQPSEGDWAFGVKLGSQGKGIFARGRITKIAEPKRGHSGTVWIHWEKFLDPRVVENLLAFPKSRRSLSQHWTPQANGTEIKNFPLAELQRLWDDHVATVRGDAKLGEPRDLLVQIRKERHEYLLKYFGVKDEPGEVLPVSKWTASNKELERLKRGGSLWIVTVRPGNRLWLVGYYPSPKLEVHKTGDRYHLKSEPNEVAMCDITDSIGDLEFENRKRIDPRPGVMAQSAQTPGVLLPESAELLRRLTSNKQDGLVDHVFSLRANLDVVLRLPSDLTLAEAQDLAGFVKTLGVTPKPQPTRPRVSRPASAPGLGPSTKPPRGKRHALPKTVSVRGALKGKPSSGTRVGSGRGYVDVGLQLDGGATSTAIFMPAGLVMISKSTSTQNGLLVQDVRIVVPAKARTQWILAMYCANHDRSPADDSDEFEFGPVTQDPAFKDLFEILAGRTIPDDMTDSVQQAVWQITDGGGLTPETRAMLTALPLAE